MSERNSAYMDSWMESARHLRQGYQPGYSLPDVKGAAQAAGRGMRALRRKRTLAVAAIAAALLASVWLLGVHSENSEAPAPASLWYRAGSGFTSGFAAIGNWLGAALEVGQEEYEKHVTEVFLNELSELVLPDDIADSVGCFVDEMINGPDIQRARGMVGGFGVSPERTQWYWDQAQFGWKPIRSQLRSIGGLPLDSAVKPVEELTSRERALLAPYYDIQGYLGARSRPGTNIRVDEFANMLAQSKGETWSPRKYLTATLGPEGYVAMVEAKRAFSKDEADRWLARNFLVQVASPVTGRVFEPDHREFSRGNGYIQQITDPQEIARLQQAVRKASITLRADNYVSADDDHDWSALEGVSWLYFRIYGESEIIAEGVYIHDPAGYPPPALRYMGDPAKLTGLIYTSLKAARQPAPDYEEWLAARSHDELVAIAVSRQGWVEALATSRDLELSDSDVSLNKLRRGNVRGLRGDTIAGLPLNDPLPALSDLEQDERVLIATALRGDKSALSWFSGTGATVITSFAEWMQCSFSRDQLTQLLWSDSEQGGKLLKDYMRKLPPPYASGTPYSYFLPIYRDFEPYQGYFERIVEPEAFAKVERAAGHPVKDAIYFRLYGAERVIAEGVWAE